jgi:PAS fold
MLKRQLPASGCQSAGKRGSKDPRALQCTDIVAEGQLWTARSDGRAEGFMNQKAAPEIRPRFDVGHTWVNLLPGKDRDAALKTWSESTATARPSEVEHRFRQSDGTYRWFRCRVEPVTTANGDPGVDRCLCRCARQNAPPRIWIEADGSPDACSAGSSKLVRQGSGEAQRDLAGRHSSP